MRQLRVASRARLAAFGACTLLSGGATCDEVEAPAPAVGVTVDRLAEAEIIQAVLPGRALALSAPLPGSGAGALAVLVAPEGNPTGRKALYRLDPTAGGSLDLLTENLPPEADAIGQIADGTGGRQLIAGEPGRILALGELGDPVRERAPRLLLASPSLDLAMLSRLELLQPDRRLILQPLLGRLEVFSAADSGDLRMVKTIQLPLRAERQDRGLRLSTPVPYLLDRPERALPLIALGPERHGNRRLLTTLIDPLEPRDSKAARAAAWSRLTADEKVVQSWYFAVDGRPILVVAVLRADRMGIFEKKKLRVFPLRTDRSRAGTPPSLEILTATRNWYEVGVRVADFDLDGREDLLVVQPDGLGAKKLAVEVYRGKGNGGFFNEPRRSAIIARGASWAFDYDLAGDRVPDLVAIDSSQRLQIFTGLRQSKRRLFDKTPHHDLSLAPDRDSHLSIKISVDADSDERPNDLKRTSPPIITDFDDDGRGEILIRSEVGGRSILRWVILR